MMQLTKKQYDKILEKQCKMVGQDYRVVFKNFLENKPMPKEWFLQHSWTEKQQKEFSSWLTKYLSKIMKYHSKRLINKYVSWWIFDYGWKLEQGDKQCH